MINNLIKKSERFYFFHIFIFVLFLAPTLSAQNSTSYSLKKHAITLESERAIILVDPSITFLFLAGSDFNGFDNIRGAKFNAVVDGNFTAGGELLERQATLSPFLTDFSRKSDRLPGWGRFKTLSSLTDTDVPLKVDVARATGFIEWSEKEPENDSKGFNARLSNEALNFGWALSPMLLNGDDVPYPSVKIGWQGSNINLDLRAFQWIGDERGPMGSTTEPLFNRIHGTLASVKYVSKSWGGAMLLGRAKEQSQDTSSISPINTISISGFSIFQNIRISGELSTSSTSEEGISWQIGGEYSKNNISTGIYHYVTQADLYGRNGETAWSNSGIPLGIMTGGNTESSVIFAKYKNELSPKWILFTEWGALKSTDYNYDLKWVKANISRVLIEDWDLSGRVSFEHIIPGNNLAEGPSGWVIYIGFIHGIINP
jgi:hypothetical protein